MASGAPKDLPCRRPQLAATKGRLVVISLRELVENRFLSARSTGHLREALLGGQWRVLNGSKNNGYNLHSLGYKSKIQRPQYKRIHSESRCFVPWCELHKPLTVTVIFLWGGGYHMILSQQGKTGWSL